MVTAMTALLKCSGVNEDDMRTEEFVKSFRKNGGDDETRTRDLCRDSGPLKGFTTTYKTAGTAKGRLSC